MITIVSFKKGKQWFVQGLNIDFCARADTLDEAMLHFWSGLALTFWTTQQETGNVQSMMRPPPPEAIQHLENILGPPIPTVIKSTDSLH